MDFIIGLTKPVTCGSCRSRQGMPTGHLTLDRNRVRTKLTARVTCQRCGYTWQAQAPRIIQAAATRARLRQIPIREGTRP